MLVLVR
jgi:hypothetical protein